ncbi:DUF349 domain-containing protein [Dermabacter vaginalis]|uniref:DUF349 domain-containing protein n=1 Tax=Dermabacter vaginalis TaxID=1630135 RepID=UPI0021A6CE87|nr:DUF349 domain-containing protein [Dermabacter vaginalis]MCT2150137.1 DUF349 domain-containing protein [Dermabacter vaginalis]
MNENDQKTPETTAPEAPEAVETPSTTEVPEATESSTATEAPESSTSGSEAGLAPEASTAANDLEAKDASGNAAKPQAPKPAAPKPQAPRPGAPKPGSPAQLKGKAPRTPLVPIVPTATSYDDAKVTEALAYGEVNAEGTVTVKDGTQIREIGTVEKGTERDKALTPFAHAYLDLSAFLDVVDQKLQVPGLTQADLNRILEQMRKNMKEPKVVGDIPALRERAHELRERAKELIGELEKARLEAREESTKKRTAFVEGIEDLVATDSHRISWKKAAARMRSMVPDWKEMQKNEVSLEREVEDKLWKRLSAARSEFDRKRRAHFSELDEQHAEAEKIKARLIEQAEAIQDSEDFGPTAREFRSLMDQWRAAPRGNRKKDDAQWAKFKAAQDSFFERRNADLKKIDAEQSENLKVKEGLLAEAEALLPITDLGKAKEQFRSIEDRFDAAGRVPRNAMRRVDERIRAVRAAFQKAEDDEWRRTDPRTKARVEGASSQLHAAIASYEDDLEKAKATGDAKKIEKAQAALDARREWLEVIERSAKDLG